MEEQILEEQTISYGQKMVGIDFNPSGDQRVIDAKSVCADIIDGLNGILRSDPTFHIERMRNVLSSIIAESNGDMEVARMIKTAEARLEEIRRQVDTFTTYIESSIPEVLVAQMLAVKAITWKG